MKNRFQVGDYVRCFTTDYCVTTPDALCKIVKIGLSGIDNINIRVKVVEHPIEKYKGLAFDVNSNNFKLEEKAEKIKKVKKQPINILSFF